MSIIADRLIVTCAFRYALGRMSYMPDHVATWLIANSDEISEHDKAAMVKEIDEAAEFKRLGMDCDVETWMKVRRHFAPATDETDAEGRG